MKHKTIHIFINHDYNCTNFRKKITYVKKDEKSQPEKLARCLVGKLDMPFTRKYLDGLNNSSQINSLSEKLKN